MDKLKEKLIRWRDSEPLGSRVRHICIEVLGYLDGYEDGQDSIGTTLCKMPDVRTGTTWVKPNDQHTT